MNTSPRSWQRNNTVNSSSGSWHLSDIINSSLGSHGQSNIRKWENKELDLVLVAAALIVAALLNPTAFIIGVPASACGTVTENTELDEDITVSGDCFYMEADNIVLDCNSHRIAGGGGGAAITAKGRSGIVVKNCEISGFRRGIYFSGVSNSRIEGNTLSWNENGGWLEKTFSTSVADNTVAGNKFYGVYMVGSEKNTLGGNSISKNNWGIYLITSFTNSITGNTIVDNPDIGVAIVESSQNRVWKNTIRGSTRPVFTDDPTSNEIDQ